MLFNESLFNQAIEDSQNAFNVSYSREQVEQLKAFILDFIKWNKVHNLSAVNSFEVLLRAHLLDSMAVVKPVGKYFNQQKISLSNLADLGSGGGFPSVILAILLPNINIYAIESIKKKTAFLKSIQAKLKLQNYFVIDQRIETYAEKMPKFFDATISRAFTELKNFLAYSELLIKDNAIVFAMKSQRVEEELSVIDNQWKILENIELKIPNLDAYRCLLILTTMRK